MTNAELTWTFVALVLSVLTVVEGLRHGIGVLWP